MNSKSGSEAPSILNLLRSAATTPTNLGQARGDRPRPEDDRVPQNKETPETNQFSLLARSRVVCVRARGHTHR